MTDNDRKEMIQRLSPASEAILMAMLELMIALIRTQTEYNQNQK